MCELHSRSVLWIHKPHMTANTMRILCSHTCCCDSHKREKVMLNVFNMKCVKRLLQTYFYLHILLFPSLYLNELSSWTFIYILYIMGIYLHRRCVVLRWQRFTVNWNIVVWCSVKIWIQFMVLRLYIDQTCLFHWLYFSLTSPDPNPNVPVSCLTAVQNV